MRFGKKTNILDTTNKKTRSCVVRLEKVLSPSPPPPVRSSTERRRTLQSCTTLNIKASLEEGESFVDMGATPKQTPLANSREERNPKGRPIVRSTVQKNRQQTTTTTTTNSSSNMSALRSNQKIKAIPRANRTATPRSSATPVREETPTPTIAAGRSRRAIKPNPKYASEDMVTPKMMRNVGNTKSTAAANESSLSSSRQRKASTSSDDFYNNNSDDDYEDLAKRNFSRTDDMESDKAYRADERDEANDIDSDISEIEQILTVKNRKLRGRPRKTEAANNSTQNAMKSQSVKRPSNASVLPVRTVPTQLQQLRRSLASANAQRNQGLLSGSGIAQKRKLDDSQDSEDSDNIAYKVPRKQILLSSSSGSAGGRLRVPVKESSIISSSSGGGGGIGSSTLNRNRVLTIQKVGNSANSTNRSINGKPLKSQLTDKRRLLDTPNNKKSIDLPSKTLAKSTTMATSLRDSNNMQQQVMPVRINKAQIPGGGTKLTAAMPSSSAAATNKNLLGNSGDYSRNRQRTSSPRPSVNKESSSLNNNSSKSNKSSPGNEGSTPQMQRKLYTMANKSSLEKSKLASTPPSNSNTTAMTISKSINVKTKAQNANNDASKSPSAGSNKNNNSSSKEAMNDDSPNSTMDDFETMPTFTIVNVNDIINKKGDVLITKTKAQPKAATAIEFSESISLDEEEVGEEMYNEDADVNERKQKDKSNKTRNAGKLNRLENNKNKSSPTARFTANDQLKKQSVGAEKKTSPMNKPEILNHKLGLRTGQRVTPKTTKSQTVTASEKPAPRILNSVVAKRTQPVKPMIANLDDSAEESFPLSMDEEEEETEDETENNNFYNNNSENKSQSLAAYSLELDTEEEEDLESQNTEPEHESLKQALPSKALAPKNNSVATTPQTSPQATAQRRKRPPNSIATPIVVSSNKKRILTPAAAKENSLAATNKHVNANDNTTTKSNSSSLAVPPVRKPPAEKVVISKQGDKIIKKITCFETWYVINMPLEPKRQTVIRNQLDMPLIRLANSAKSIQLPSELWSCKVTLYELSAITLAKSTLVTYTGDLTEYNISEEDRGKYQPSCVMFRRSIENRQVSRMPYDRAVIFKNKTFSTNIEGKNIRLLGAPSVINSEKEIEILLQVVDALTLQSDFVENITPP